MKEYIVNITKYPSEEEDLYKQATEKGKNNNHLSLLFYGYRPEKIRIGTNCNLILTNNV